MLFRSFFNPHFHFLISSSIPCSHSSSALFLILVTCEALAFKQIAEQGLRQQVADDIWTRFLERESELEININDKLWQGIGCAVRESLLVEVKQTINPAKLNCFDRVIVEVKKIICRDSINAFVASKPYLDYKCILVNSLRCLHPVRQDAGKRLIECIRTDNFIEMDQILAKIDSHEQFLREFDKPDMQGEN